MVFRSDNTFVSILESLGKNGREGANLALPVVMSYIVRKKVIHLILNAVLNVVFAVYVLSANAVKSGTNLQIILD